MTSDNTRPAGGAVTATQLLNLLNQCGLHVSDAKTRSGAMGAIVEGLEAAAARLSAPQPVAFDPDLLDEAWGIIANAGGGNWTRESADWHGAAVRWRDKYHAWLDRRHAAAPAVGVVEVTASTLAGAHGRASMTDRPGSHWDRMAAEINTTLRARAGTATPNSGSASSSSVVTETAAGIEADPVIARAGTAGQTTGAQWVKRPAGQASALVVPEDGLYWSRIGTTPNAGTAHHLTAGHVVQDAWSAIRRIDTDAPTTWIERTATAGGWTAESVAACVGQRRVVSINEGERGHLCDWTAYDAASIAARFNAVQVTAYYILPPVEVQP